MRTRRSVQPEEKRSLFTDGSTSQECKRAEKGGPVDDEKKNGLVPMKEIIAALLADPALQFNPEEAKIWRVWEETVGPVVAPKAHPQWIRKGRLRVKVTEPIWLQELGFAEKTIRDKLNEKLGGEPVQKIEFRLALR